MTLTEPVAAWATDCRDKYAENHDSGYAGRICMADGNLAWAAVISDGAGGSMEGLKVSALAIQAFVEAVRTSSLAELFDPTAREAWVRSWTKALHADAFARFKGGMATFCGAVLLPPVAEGGDWKLFSLNVGDSQVWRLTGDGKCMGITPDAPPNNANVEGHNPIRVVGVAPKGDFALIDIEEFPLPADGPCWVLAGSDGFFSKKKGKDELSIFASGDFRDVCLGGAPFQDLPALAIRRSLANAQKLGCAEMMDNATVAMLGFRVPATNLSAAGGGGSGLPAATASKTAAEGQRPPAAAPKAAPAAGKVQRPPASAPTGGGRQRPSGIGKATVAAALFAALAAGLALGSLFAPKAKTAETPPEVQSAPAVSAPVNLQGLPKTGRCPYCLALFKEGKLREADTFHWWEDCKRRPGGTDASRPSPARP